MERKKTSVVVAVAMEWDDDDSDGRYCRLTLSRVRSVRGATTTVAMTRGSSVGRHS